MAGTDYNEDDAPTLPSKPGHGSSDVLRQAFDRAAETDRPAEAEPEMIGPYRVLGRVGRGGMGSVYKATDDRENSAQRVVAIKLIRKGLDTEDVLRRFKLEGQLLAALNHPNIARLYEVAETPEGQPYFVMEYVDGKPLDKYCDEKRVPISGRLEIFRKVCAAVHHAHTNLIVHRDLKPGNILVTPEGEPKLLDFGIAKLLNPTLGRVEVLTRPTMRIMTPEYASPEQVSGSTVGTRSDVYSLGVLLYELLSGRRPYQFAKRIEAEVVRVICESIPVRPSTAITSAETAKAPSEQTTAGGIGATIAQSRAVERIESLRRSLTGDLDDIVMMAISKSEDRRYPSAEHFSRDLERYLKGLPVEARKTGSRRIYQMRKFLRRHRIEVAAVALMILAITAGGTATALQWRQASIANARAAQELEERLRAEQELTVASAYGDALWDQANTELTFSMTPLERDAFWKGLQARFDELADRFDTTSPSVRLAESRALIQAGNAMGGIRSGNTGEFTAALAAYELARDTLVELHELDPTNAVVWSDAVEAQLRVADVLRRTNKPSEAMKAYERAIELAESTVFPEETLQIQRQRSKPRLSLGQTALLLGDQDLAQEMFEREESERRERAAKHSDSLTARRDLAVVLLNFGELRAAIQDLDGAKSKIDESLAIRRSLLQERPAHVTLRRDVANGLIAQGILSAAQDDAETARQNLDEAIGILRPLIAEVPSDARLPYTAATGLIEHATASIRAGSDTEAARSVSAAEPFIESLESLAPQHPALSSLRARKRLLLAQVELAAENIGPAAAGFELARDQIATIAAFDPSSISNRLLHGDALVGLGESRRLLALESGDEQALRSAIMLIEEARRVYSSCGAPGEAFGPAERWWAIVDEHTTE